MTVIYDKKGNMFSAEMIIAYEHDAGELKLLAQALLEQHLEFLNDKADQEQWLKNRIEELTTVNSYESNFQQHCETEGLIQGLQFTLNKWHAEKPKTTHSLTVKKG
jgi:hypothetical protein